MRRTAGRHALVDGIPFTMPVDSRGTEGLMAVFPIDPSAAAALLPCDQLHPVRLWRKALLTMTAINYRETDIGRYVELSLAIPCTRGPKPAPRLLPLAFRRLFGTGQLVFDLPVSTEISVKGGKGIWGLPKHRASLDFLVTDESASSRYEIDGAAVMEIRIRRPRHGIAVSVRAASYAAFRGLLYRAVTYISGRVQLALGRCAHANLVLGDHPAAGELRSLGIGERPLLTAYFPDARGVLDDRAESWFITSAIPPPVMPEGLESVAGLGLGQEWPPAPTRPASGVGAHP